MSKHTPGPWHYDARHALIMSNRAPIAKVFGTPTDTDEEVSNGRLLAAAPDLLEALEARAEWERHFYICQECSKFHRCETGKVLYNLAVDLHVNATNKAKGEEEWAVLGGLNS